MPTSPPPFDVECDGVHNLLVLHLRGFWDLTIANAYIDAVNKAAGQLPALGAHGSIIDLTGFTVQSKDVLAMIVGYTRDTEPRAARMAWIGGTALQRMQLRRTLDEMGGRIFETHADARRWIIAEAASSRAPQRS